MDKKIFFNYILKLTTAFDMKLSKEQIDVWYEYLGNLTEKELKQRIDKTIKICNKKPFVADVLGIKEEEVNRANAGAYRLIE